MSSLTRFPIKITDQFANEAVPGLCPVLSADVAQSPLASSGAVVSEYGFRKALNDEMEGKLTETNIGPGAKVCESDTFDEITNQLGLDIRRIKFRGRRFTGSVSNRVIGIAYDNVPGKTVLNASNSGVQGGSLHESSNPTFATAVTYFLYCVCGYDSTNTYLYDNIEYLISTNTCAYRTAHPYQNNFGTGYKMMALNGIVNEGSGGRGQTNTTRYDINTTSWTDYGATLPNSVGGHSYGRYAFFDSDRLEGITRTVWQVWMFDSATGTYAAQTAVPGGLTNLVYGGMGQYVRGKGYNHGGGTDYNSGTAYHDLVMYDPVGVTWSLSTNLPLYRASFNPIGMVTNNGTTECLYHIGGYVVAGGGTVAYRYHVSEYNPVTTVWTTKSGMPSPLHYARRYASRSSRTTGITLGSKGFESPVRECYKYAANTDTWTQPGNLPKGVGSMTQFT